MCSFMQDERLTGLHNFYLLTIIYVAPFYGIKTNNADPDRTMGRLIRVSTVCFQNVLLKIR